MRTLTIFSAALTVAAFAAAPASAQPSKAQCINRKDIAETISPEDGETLRFRMTNGTIIVNHLKPRCDGLKWGGFSWVIQPGGDIRSGSQVLRSFVTGELCRLGAFDAPVKMSSAR